MCFANQVGSWPRTKYGFGTLAAARVLDLQIGKPAATLVRAPGRNWRSREDCGGRTDMGLGGRSTSPQRLSRWTGEDLPGAPLDRRTAHDRHAPRKNDHRPPTTDHRPPTTDHRPPTTDHRPPTTDHGYRTNLVVTHGRDPMAHVRQASELDRATILVDARRSSRSATRSTKPQRPSMRRSSSSAVTHSMCTACYADPRRRRMPPDVERVHSQQLRMRYSVMRDGAYQADVISSAVAHSMCTACGYADPRRRRMLPT
jgi:hypothetical protein